MSIQKLRQQHFDAKKELDLVTKSSPFDAAKSDRLCNEVERLEKDIRAMQRSLDLLAEKEADDIERDWMARKVKGSDAVKVFDKWLRGGIERLSADDREVFRNTMSTGVPSEGGYTVPVEVATSVIDQLKAFGGMRAVSTVIASDSGNDINFPTSNGTAEEGELVGENQAASALDLTFGVVAHKIYRDSSKKIAVPIELLMDSAVDVEAFVRGRLVSRLGRITNKHFTLGTGTGQPFGVVEAASQGVVAANGTSQVTAVTYDSLVELQHSVDPAYRESGTMRFMFNDDTLSKIRKIKDQNGRPIFVPGYESGNPGGAPDLLLGAPIQINQNMPNMAAGAKSILYGDFSYYIIRDVLDIGVRRYTDSAFDLLGQVGFCAFLRTGGNLIEPQAVKYFQNAAS